MGIQLPPELTDVAAKTGVVWPEADEDKLRQSAQAWRDAGTKLTTLTTDADHTARTALNAVHGQTGDAASRHWSTFVHPDTGHLTVTARGAAAAADRLDHAATQVGAAKLEIVRNLVSLAKNTDAAHTSAAAGHPHALLGLDTAIQGTAANVTHITNTLERAVQPATGIDVSTTGNLVNPNPGTHGPGQHHGLLGMVTDTAQGATNLGAGSGPQGPGSHHGLLGAVTDTAQGLVGSGAGGPGQPHGPVSDLVQGLLGGPATGGPGQPHGLVSDLTQGLVGGPGQSHGALGAVSDLAHGVVGDVTGAGPAHLPVDVGQRVDLPGNLGDGPPGFGHPGDGSPMPGHPAVTGPVRIPVDGGPAHLDLPTPPAGVPLGQTVQAGLTPGAVIDSAGPAPAPASPLSAVPLPPAAEPPAPSAPGAGGPAPGFAPGPSGGPPPAAGPAAPLAGAAPVPAGDQPRVGPDRARGPLTLAVPPAAQSASAQPAQPMPKDRPDTPEVFFWMHMFPIGHMPVVSDRPARQLPPPPAEVDYAPGMRFEPGDHPEHHDIDGSWRLDELRAGVPPLTPPAGLSAGHPEVRALSEGHDPLGGQHERDWDRRYLVRLGSVTADGISDDGKEYAWPPGERYPEGGTAAGEPEMLAEGTVIDRFGSPEGRVFSAEDTAFARRSLPPELLNDGYHRYRVTRPLPVWRTVSAPWFAQPGGAERYRTTYSAIELLALGYLADITGGGA